MTADENVLGLLSMQPKKKDDRLRCTFMNKMFSQPNFCCLGRYVLNGKASKYKSFWATAFQHIKNCFLESLLILVSFVEIFEVEQTGIHKQTYQIFDTQNVKEQYIKNDIS